MARATKSNGAAVEAINEAIEAVNAAQPTAEEFAEGIAQAAAMALEAIAQDESAEAQPEEGGDPIGPGATIGKLLEAEYRFDSGFRLQVAENALVGWVADEGDQPYRWRVVSTADQVIAEGGCNGGYAALRVAHSAMMAAAVAHTQVLESYRTATPGVVTA